MVICKKRKTSHGYGLEDIYTERERGGRMRGGEKEERQCGKTGKENGTGITFKTVVTGKLLMFHRRVNIQYYMGSTNCT